MRGGRRRGARPGHGHFACAGSFDPANLRLIDSFIGEDWLAERRSPADEVDLVASAPLTTAPFTAAASQGAWLLGGTAAMAMLSAVVIPTE